MNTAMSRPRAAVASAILAILVGLTSTPLALAGRMDFVDPALMTPALNPSFEWDCWRSGDKIVCQGEQSAEHDAIEAIPCPDGGWIYLTGTERQTLRRVSDQDGLALWTVGTFRADGHVSRSAAFDGIVGHARSVWNDRYDYVVPGDITSRIHTRSGFDPVVTIPGQGVVMLDVGVWSVDIEGNLLFAHGQHPALEDIEAAFATVCEALA